MSEAAIDHVADAGYDPSYGARPLKRAIQRELENPLATLILEDNFSEGSTVKIGMNKAGELTFKMKAPVIEPVVEDGPAEEEKEEGNAVSA